MHVGGDDDNIDIESNDDVDNDNGSHVLNERLCEHCVVIGWNART